ncbi:MAG: hypothetical protein AB7O57_19505 [Hyphomicrobiaceae bacterium]
MAPAPTSGSSAAPGIRIAQALDRGYFVGAWETHNTEHGRDVRIVWTVRDDSSLDYDFVVDGVGFRGSTGTWDFRDGTLYETWVRPDGSTGSGTASIERIDDNTFRLTVIDNGADEYRGLVRVYRRLGPPQFVARDCQRTPSQAAGK